MHVPATTGPAVTDIYKKRRAIFFSYPGFAICLVVRVQKSRVIWDYYQGYFMVYALRWIRKIWRLLGELGACVGPEGYNLRVI
jgi:hypothetical protein